MLLWKQRGPPGPFLDRGSTNLIDSNTASLPTRIDFTVVQASRAVSFTARDATISGGTPMMIGVQRLAVLLQTDAAGRPQISCLAVTRHESETERRVSNLDSSGCTASRSSPGPFSRL